MSTPLTIEELQKQLEYERQQRQIYEAKLNEVLKLLNVTQPDSFPLPFSTPSPSSSSLSSINAVVSTAANNAPSSSSNHAAISLASDPLIETKKKTPSPRKPSLLTVDDTASPSEPPVRDRRRNRIPTDQQHTVSSSIPIVIPTPERSPQVTEPPSSPTDPPGCSYCGKLDHWANVCRVRKRDEKFLGNLAAASSSSSSSSVSTATTATRSSSSILPTDAIQSSVVSPIPPKNRTPVKDMTCTYCNTKGHHEGICRHKVRNDKQHQQNILNLSLASTSSTVKSENTDHHDSNTVSPNVSGINTPSTGYQTPSSSLSAPNTPARSQLSATTTTTAIPSTPPSDYPTGVPNHSGIRTNESHTTPATVISLSSVLLFPPPPSFHNRQFTVPPSMTTMTTTTVSTVPGTKSKNGIHAYLLPAKPPSSPSSFSFSTPNRPNSTNTGTTTPSKPINTPSPVHSNSKNKPPFYTKAKVIEPNAPLPLETNLPTNLLSTTVYVYGYPIVAIFNPQLMYNILPFNFWRTIPLPYRPIVTTVPSSSKAVSGNGKTYSTSSNSKNEHQIYGTIHADILMVASLQRKEHKNTSVLFERQISLPFYLLRGSHVPNYIVIGKSTMEQSPLTELLTYLQDPSVTVSYSSSPGSIKSNAIFTGERKLAHVTAFGIQATTLPVPGDTEDTVFPLSPFSTVDHKDTKGISIEELSNQSEYQLSHCSKDTQQLFHNVVHTYGSIWRTNGNGSTKTTTASNLPTTTVHSLPLPTAHLHVRPGTRPNREGENTRYAPKLAHRINSWFDRLVHIGYAEYCTDPENDPSLWVNSTVTFTKEDGSIEVVLDLVYLNEFVYGLTWNYEGINKASPASSNSKNETNGITSPVKGSANFHAPSTPTGTLITTNTDPSSYTSLASRKLFSSFGFSDYEWRYSLDVSSRNYAGFRTPSGRYGRFIKIPIGLHILSSVVHEPLDCIFNASLANRATNTTILLNNDYVCIGSGSKDSKSASSVATAEDIQHHIDTLVYVFETVRMYGLRIIPLDSFSSPSSTSVKEYFSNFLQPTGKFMGTLFGNDSNNTGTDASSSSSALPLPIPSVPSLSSSLPIDSPFLSLSPDRSSRLPSWLNIVPPYNGPDKEYVIRLVHFVTYFLPYYQHLPDCMKALQLLTILANEYTVAGRWRISHRNAWILLRDTIFYSSAVTTVPQWNTHFYIRVDASVGSWAVYILQYNSVTADPSSSSCTGVPNIIGYYAYRFNTVQQAWENNVREAYAIVAAVRIVRKWMRNYGTQYTVDENNVRKVRCPNYTFQIDHRNLSAMANSEDTILRRWYYELRTYYFDTQHWPGKINVISDFGSRDNTAPLTRASDLVSLKNRIVQL